MTALHRPSISELADRVLAEGLGPDARLPTERQLSASFGVTRAAVRLALAQLEAAGRVSREVGRGTFLRNDASTSPVTEPDGPPPTDIGPADVMAARLVLEPHAMPLAVARATARDLDTIARNLAGGDGATTFTEFETWDLALHRSLIAATHSPLVIRLYAAVEDARHGQLWGQLKRRADTAERREQYRCQHHDIVDALLARDSAQAVSAMSTHLAIVEFNLLGRVI